MVFVQPVVSIIFKAVEVFVSGKMIHICSIKQYVLGENIIQ